MTSIRDKIAKLQRLADSTTFAGERDAALAQIAKLKGKLPEEPAKPLPANPLRLNINLREASLNPWIIDFEDILKEDAAERLKQMLRAMQEERGQ